MEIGRRGRLYKRWKGSEGRAVENGKRDYSNGEVRVQVVEGFVVHRGLK